jgi:hypothetical protein
VRQLRRDWQLLHTLISSLCYSSCQRLIAIAIWSLLTSGLLAWSYVCTGALASIAQAQHEKEEQWLRSLLANLGEDEGAGNVFFFRHVPDDKRPFCQDRLGTNQSHKSERNLTKCCLRFSQATAPPRSTWPSRSACGRRSSRMSSVRKSCGA